MLSELLPEVKRKLHELEQQHILLEKNAVRNPAQQNGAETDMYMKLNEMNFRLDELDKLVLREPKAKRDDYRRFLNKSNILLYSNMESFNILYRYGT